MQPISDEFPLMLEREAGMTENVPPVAVGFGLQPHLNNKKTKQMGYKVYEDRVYVKIAVPGDKNSLVFQPASEAHKQRFPKAWAAFQASEHVVREGLPIDHWAPITRSMALTLRSLHIYTVEALAQVHDGLIDKLGASGRDLRSKAQSWLKDAQTGAERDRLASEKSELQGQIASLQAQMQAMQEQFDKRKRRSPTDAIA